MFTDFTLIPGGGFVMCESGVSDFDVNAPTPPITEEKAVSLLKDNCDNDPVMKAIEKLKKTYQEYIQPLMNLNYQPEDSQSILQTTEQIRIVASAISERSIKLITKICGTLMIQDKTYGNRYCGDKFYANAGLFIKNMKRIKQLGLKEYQYTVDYLFNGEWQLYRMLDVFQAKPDLLDEFISGEMLDNISCPDCPVSDMFDGIGDAMNVIFNDIDRLCKLEHKRDNRITIERLLTLFGQSNSSNEMCYVTSERDCDGPTLIRFVSSIVRKTMQETYEIQCRIADAENGVNPDLSKMMMRLTNLFGIVTLYIVSKAYTLRERCAWARAADQYTDALLRSLATD